MLCTFKPKVDAKIKKNCPLKEQRKRDCVLSAIGINSVTLWKFQLSFLHFLNVFGLRDRLPPPPPPGISNPLCGGSMDIFWNQTLSLVTDHLIMVWEKLKYCTGQGKISSKMFVTSCVTNMQVILYLFTMSFQICLLLAFACLSGFTLKFTDERYGGRFDFFYFATITSWLLVIILFVMFLLRLYERLTNINWNLVVSD